MPPKKETKKQRLEREYHDPKNWGPNAFGGSASRAPQPPPLAIGAGPTKCPDCARREAAGHCPACYGVENGIPRLQSPVINRLMELVRSGEIHRFSISPKEAADAAAGRYVVYLGDYVIARVDDPKLVRVEMVEAMAVEAASTRLPITGMMETLAALDLVGKRLMHQFWTGEQKA
jgi:hypothetical protein